MITVGIDIGTSYSSIAILDADGKAQPVKVKNGECIFGDSYSMPTAVFIDESGAILIGQSAVSKKMMNPSRYKGEFKRELGQDTPYHLGNLQLMPEDLYKEIFIYFKKCAEEASGDKIGKAYITYPANFSNKKKTLVEQAAKKAGIINVELIDEPTAAAYCYFSKGKINNGEKLLVYDFGGGTFDLALIEYTKGAFKPMTDALGIEKCGGVEIDRIIFDDILSSISDDILESIKQNETHRKRFYAQLMEMSIKAKHQLSSTESYSDIIMAGFESIEYNLSRTRLTSMIASLVDETLLRVKEIVKNARLEFKDIDTVLLVGGTSRIPYIKECLERLIGKTAYRDIDPELAVCMGAALWNEMLENKEEEKENSNEILISNIKTVKDDDNGNFKRHTIAHQNGWIYYTDFDCTLFKISEDGTQRIKLSEEKILCINIVDDWIYYVNVSDKYKLYKMRLDGSQKIKMSDISLSRLHIYEDWIYYCNSQENLCKMSMDCNKIVNLCDDKINKFLISNNCIYCLKYESFFKSDTLYKIKTDGTMKTKLNGFMLSSFSVKDDWIYYGYDGLYKSRLDTTGIIKLDTEYTTDIYIIDDWIYYLSSSNKDIYKIYKDGTNKKLLYKGTSKINDMCFLDNCVYFTTFSGDIGKVTMDGDLIYLK